MKKKQINPTGPYRTGYARHSSTYSGQRQMDELIRDGIPDGQIYLEGRMGQSLTEAVKSLRSADEVLETFGGFRALGDSRKQITEASEILKAHNAVIRDIETGERSDRDCLGMILKTLSRISREGLGPPIEARRAGGKKSGQVRKLSKQEQRDRVRPTWFDQRYVRDQDAAAAITEAFGRGWSPQSCRREFGSSGRPEGRKPKSLGEVEITRKKK